MQRWGCCWLSNAIKQGQIFILNILHKMMPFYDLAAVQIKILIQNELKKLDLLVDTRRLLRTRLGRQLGWKGRGGWVSQWHIDHRKCLNNASLRQGYISLNHFRLKHHVFVSAACLFKTVTLQVYPEPEAFFGLTILSSAVYVKLYLWYLGNWLHV